MWGFSGCWGQFEITSCLSQFGKSAWDLWPLPPSSEPTQRCPCSINPPFYFSPMRRLMWWKERNLLSCLMGSVLIARTVLALSDRNDALKIVCILFISSWTLRLRGSLFSFFEELFSRDNCRRCGRDDSSVWKESPGFLTSTPLPSASVIFVRSPVDAPAKPRLTG